MPKKKRQMNKTSAYDKTLSKGDHKSTAGFISYSLNVFYFLLYKAFPSVFVNTLCV